MAGYNDTRNLIIEALMGRQAGTEIQPEKHQAYALNMLDYVRSVELVSSSTLVGLAEESTVPVQPDRGKVCYIAGVGQDRTVTFSNFIDDEGNPISITTGEMEGVFVILLWNMEHWVAYTFNTNIISSAESANFYYGYNIRKTHTSVAAMNADSVNPIGTDGRLIKIGELVTVVNSTTPAENGYYSYEGSENGWLLQSGFSFEVVQTTGTDINKPMSQKAVTDELALKIDKTSVKQTTGDSTTDVMSQKAVTDELALKIDKTSVKQTTGDSTTDVMSQKAVTDELALKIDKITDELALKIDKTSVKQTTGDSTTDVMSQKAVTDELGTKASHGYETEPKTLKQVDDEKADHGYDVEETPKTLKQVDDEVSQLAGEVSLLDAVQGAKIKDIENVLSTANLNQSAQLSVSGRKTVSLPKNTANGGMSVKLEGLSAGNLVANGDFRNGLTGWNFGYSANSVTNGVLTNTGSGTIFEPYTYSNIGNKVVGNKYYLRANVTAKSALCTRIRIGSLNIAQLIDSPIVNNPYLLSGVITASSTYEFIAVYHMYASTADANGASIEVDNAMAINLTATFGAGNEPTKEQCDLMFADYFEGVKSFEPTGRIRSVDASGENPTHLYLTAPELRSNGLVKDEIRKGANGYELVKRVGVGTSNGEIVTGGDFSDPSKWTVVGSIISNGTLKIIADAGITSYATQNKTITAGKIYRYKIDVLSITGTAYLYIGNTIVRTIRAADSGQTISGFFLSPTGGTYIELIKDLRLIKDLSSNVNAEFDNISILEYNTTEGVAIAGGEAVYGSNVHYTLATPVITPISHGGILNSAENGTVYHEPVVADAGVYGTKMDILLTDYPIATIEEIIKHENGVDTYLNVATAVIAGDGLSFTHPDLASGDLVLFTYSFDKESTNGNITATFYDSNVVKIDTVTGKAYRINEVVTNGVLTRTLTEV